MLNYGKSVKKVFVHILYLMQKIEPMRTEAISDTKYVSIG